MTSRSDRRKISPSPASAAQPAPPAEPQRLRVLPAVLALGALGIFALAAGGLLQPFQDYDFFWHLRTGKWIWEHRALPGGFLFSPHDTGTLTTAQRFTMTSYWVVQVLYHLLYAAGGLAALAGLRFLLAGAQLATIAWRRDGDDIVYLALVAAATPLLFHWFPFDRPQIFSFVFFSLMLGLLDLLRRAPDPGRPERRRAAAVLLPLLMWLWANCHGGYLVGQLALALFLATETAKLLHPRLGPLPRGRFRLFVAAGLSGLAFSLLNPNTWHGLRIALGSASDISDNMDFLPVLEVYSLTGNREVLVLLPFLALAALALALSWRSPDLTTIALLAGTGFAAYRQNRHIPYFLLAALPVISRQLTFRRPGLLWATRAAALVAAAAVVVPAVRSQLPAYRAPRGLTAIDASLPADAAAFLEANRARGVIFNQYNWGGYLLWRLEEVKVYIDGRVFDRTVFDTYVRVLKGELTTVQGLPLWRQVLESNGIGFVVLAPFDPTSGVVPSLIDGLAADPAWTPVFLSSTAMVVARKNPANRDLTERYGIPWDVFRQRMLANCDLQIRMNPLGLAPLFAKGEMLLRTFRFPEAKAAFEQVLLLSPGHSGARMRLRQMGAAR